MEGIVSTSDQNSTDERSATEKLADAEARGVGTGNVESESETNTSSTDGEVEVTSDGDGTDADATEVTAEGGDEQSQSNGDSAEVTEATTGEGDDGESEKSDGKPKTRAERYAEAAARREAANPPKQTRASQPGKKEARRKEFPWLDAAVKAARILSGHKLDKETGEPKGDMTVEYAGPIQHVLVRKVTTERIKADGKEVTPQTVLEQSGIKSQKLLRSIATWEASEDELKPLRTLSAEMKTAAGRPDGWAKGRYLAAILSVWIDEMKAEATAAKKAEKAEKAGRRQTAKA